jgi:PAS domain S-box-containing protein
MPELDALLSGGGEMGRRIREFDWSTTSLGCPSGWPQSLRTALSICLGSSIPSAIYWGPDYVVIPNDAWAATPGSRHPQIMGRPTREEWPDRWKVNEPRLRHVVETGEGWSVEDEVVPMKRGGIVEESYWNSSLSPIVGEQGTVSGVLWQAQETTKLVLGQRRAALLIAINDRLRTMKNVNEMVTATSELVGKSLDVSWVGYSELDERSEYVRVAHGWRRQGSWQPPIAYRIDDSWQGLREAIITGQPSWINNVREHSLPEGSSEREQWREFNICAVIASPVMHGGVCCGVIIATDDRPRLWTGYHSELLRIAGSRMVQEMTRARAEHDLRVSEERHRLIFERAHDIIFTADLDHVLTSCNPAMAAAFDTTPDKLIGRSLAEFVSPESFRQGQAMLQEKLDHGGTTQHEIEAIAGPGRILQWEISSTLITDADGHVTGVQAIARDVTERKKFEAQQMLLINELNHRVKNTLALVQGLALQSFKHDRDPAEARQAFQERLGALAAAHDLLTREKWEGATIGELVADALRVHSDHPDRIETSGPKVVVSPKAAISLVLALHELGTNAAKYGALSLPEGRVEVEWSRTPDGKIRIEWRERNGPPVMPPSHSGFGLRMIERALKTDLGGSVMVEFNPDGLVCTIEAPDPALAVEGRAS